MQHDGSGISLLSPFYSERRSGRDTEEWKTSGTVWTRAQGGRDAWPYTMVRWLSRLICPRPPSGQGPVPRD